MTKIKTLHVEFCLETKHKKHRVLAALSIQRCTLSFYIIICNLTERNGMEQNGTERTGTKKQTP
jgi:hypothetical protein